MMSTDVFFLKEMPTEGNSTPHARCGAQTLGFGCWRPDNQILDDLHCAKQWEKLLIEALVVGVNVEMFVHIIEGQLVVVIVEVDAHLAGDEAGWQRGEWHRQRLKLSAPLQPQGQVPRICVQRLKTFPQGRLFSNAQPPVALSHFHLPVVATSAVALCSNGTPPTVKTLVVVGNIFSLKATAHPFLISRDEQIRVGRVQIQGHLH